MTTQALFEKIENIAALSTSNEAENLRDELQIFFDDIDFQYRSGGNVSVLSDLSRSGHALLRKIKNNSEAEKENNVCLDAAAFAENLIFCCDLLAAEWKKRIFFFSENVEQKLICNASDFSWALLNLLSNAIIFSDGKYISVTLRQYNNRLAFTVESEGGFLYEKFLSSFNTHNGKTSGLCCTQKIAKSHGGSLFMSSENGKTKVTLLFARRQKTNEPDFRIPTVEELLYDRLSVIYTALCEI